VSATDSSTLLRLAAELKDLSNIRRFVAESAEELGVLPASLPGVLLAVDEAVTNVILHGYGGQGGPVEIEVSGSPDALIIHLRDEAAPFDPTSVPTPDLEASPEQRAPGGLGVHLMRQAMDQLLYRRPASGGNELTMIKRVSHPASESGAANTTAHGIT
jgi:serine/threonine-protein kinase RsbW